MLLVKGALLVLLAALANCSAGGNLSKMSSATVGSDSGTISSVSCSEDSCSVAMGGTGNVLTIFDTTISPRTIRDGRATLRVADQEVSCAAGETVAAGSVSLRCTDVTADTVSLVATPR